MEPQISAPSPSPESGAHTNRETLPGPEVSHRNSESTPERPAQQEQQPSAAAGHAPALPPPVQPQQPAVKAPPVLSPHPVVNDNPLVAADEDLIEREWVDKAKKIVTQTKDDPYQQEKEVSKLQADYLKKRYGKEVKLAND